MSISQFVLVLVNLIWAQMLLPLLSFQMLLLLLLA
jgi:hypothetical protein